jgi:hydrogenase large subunit
MRKPVKNSKKTGLASLGAATVPQGTKNDPEGLPAFEKVTPKVVTVDPVTRIEGHLKVEVKIDKVDGKLQVVDAWSTGTLFRGVEKILENRHPWDSVPITQRICGVCPVSHGMAAVRANDDASGVTIPVNARILRNLVLGSNFVSSHMLHFYHLAALDYIEGPDMQPWEKGWSVDMRVDPATTEELINHYLTALAMRRKAHEAGAIFGGRLPAPPAYMPGGFTCAVKSSAITNMDALLDELIPFIQNTWIPDVQLLGSVYSDYFTVGRGPGNLLAYGVFDLNTSGSSKLLARGRVENGSTSIQSVDINRITEDVTWSWYHDSTNGLPPATGDTVPQFPKGDAYSWLKAPRYNNQPHEVGPLARMWVNGDYQDGISVMDRHVARAFEALKVAQAMKTWLTELQAGQPVHQHHNVPETGSGVGLTEAPRGALGHWLKIKSKKIDHYQVVTPTCWNASPRDTSGVMGPIEQALIGAPVDDMNKPISVLRVIHSFDPCLSCAVHVMRADSDKGVVIHSRGGF